MIRLEQINIAFDHPVIMDGSMIIPDAAVTVIAGSSGSGKTCAGPQAGDRRAQG